MKLFLDANVLFTAAYSPTGLSRGIIALAEGEWCQTVTSAFALEEARRNLALKAPDKAAFLEKLAPHIAVVPELPPAKIAWAAGLPIPAKDAPIMAAASACGADILATGDRRDFSNLLGKTVEGTAVMTPRDTVRLLLEGKV